MNNEASANSDRALARHAAISWVEQVLAEGYHLNRALALCSERPWGGRLYAAATIEEWYYAHRAGGFAALQRKARSDKGRRKALSPEARQALQQLRLEHPQLKVQALVRRLTEQGLLCPGPTKAFETERANELWMADMMIGPTLKLSTGKAQLTRLFCLLDDCSRLVPHGQYYGEEKLCCFLDCLRQGLAQRGFPDKLYTDQGKVFTCQHLQIVWPRHRLAASVPDPRPTSRAPGRHRQFGGPALGSARASARSPGPSALQSLRLAAGRSLAQGPVHRPGHPLQQKPQRQNLLRI
jgi:hypothetical protein